MLRPGEVLATMMAHFWEEATSHAVNVTRGFTEIKRPTFTVTEGQAPQHFRETVADTGRIKQLLFGGFQRCLHNEQKFDSDTERRFCIVLERDALKWFKPAKGQFQIYYKQGREEPEYVPDFVAETDLTNWWKPRRGRTSTRRKSRPRRIQPRVGANTRQAT